MHSKSSDYLYKCLSFTSPGMRNVGGNTVSWDTLFVEYFRKAWIFSLCCYFLAPKELVVHAVNSQQKWRFSRILLLFSFSGRVEPGDKVVKSRYMMLRAMECALTYILVLLFLCRLLLVCATRRCSSFLISIFGAVTQKGNDWRCRVFLFILFYFFYFATDKLLKKVKAHQIQIQVTMSTYVRIYCT